MLEMGNPTLMSEQEVLFLRSGKNSTHKSDCGSTTEDDIWDDTALIGAYDRAVSLAKDEVARRMGLEGANISGNDSSTSNTKQPHRKRKHKKKEWQVGSACRAVYSKDGQIYEADIQSIHLSTGQCVVKYVGYDNEEQVPLKQLQPSGGSDCRHLQVIQATQYSLAHENGLDMDCSESVSPKGSATGVNVGGFVKSSPTRKDWSKHGGRQFGRKGPYTPDFTSPQFPSVGLPPMVVPPPPPPHLMSRYPDEDTETLSAMLMSWYMSGFHTGYYQGLKQCKNSHGSLKGNSSRKS